MTLLELANGQVVTARHGRAERDGAHWEDWRQAVLYVVRRTEELSNSLRKRSTSPNVGDIITIVADGCDCEYSQGDYCGDGVFMVEDYYLQIEGLL